MSLFALAHRSTMTQPVADSPLVRPNHAGTPITETTATRTTPISIWPRPTVTPTTPTPAESAPPTAPSTPIWDYTQLPGSLQDAVTYANQIAYEGQPHNTADYWASHWATDPHYTWQRMLGYLAGGSDVARGGPYAGQDFGTQGYGSGGGSADAGSMFSGLASASGGGTSGGSQPSGLARGFSGTGTVFSDPATMDWEALLRQVTGQLTTPRPLGYTPSQLELFQTQQLDPLTRARDAQKQRAIEQYAAMGHTMTSGPLQAALLEIDRQFAELMTQAQAGIARGAVGLEDERFAGNEQRALQAVNLMGQIPALADSRLAAANQTLIPSNPLQLLNLQQQFQQQALAQANMQRQQDAQFWAMLASLLGEIFA
jgi:hypothetical protein